MKKAEVWVLRKLAGHITETALADGKKEYSFRYETEYFQDQDSPPVSLTLPKTQEIYVSATLFPFFEGLLSEGIHRSWQCDSLQIDEKDSFELLLKTAHSETVGAVTVKPSSHDLP